MLQRGSRLKVADNSGAKELEIIGGFRNTNLSLISVGDIVKVTVKLTNPGSLIKKGQVYRAVIVATRAGITRKTGEKVMFDENCAVLIKSDNQPMGTRVTKPVAREVKEKGFEKISSLATEIY